MTAAFRAVGLGWQPAERLPSHTAAVADVWSACGSRFPRPGYRDFHVPAWLPRLSVAIPPGTPDLTPATGTEDRMAGWA